MVDKRQIFIVIFLVLTLYVFVPQLGSFDKSWVILHHVKSGWAFTAISFTFLTYLFAALTYYVLSVRRIRYLQLVLVQFAAMLVNRLLPAGVGALGANYAFLRNKKHRPTEAATVIAVNNLLGIAGHLILLLIVLILSPEYSRKLAFQSQHHLTLDVGVAFVAIAVLVLVGLIFARQRISKNIAVFRSQMKLYKAHPLRILTALLSSICLTLCNVICLYASMHAVGIQLPFIIVLLIFTLGISTGTITPTPGGLGGFEAGLFAGFVAFHVPVAPALAIALLY
ncbi:MAG: YbhN family protein, partial [Candidatus Saccharimonadales bacterium]